MSFLRSALFNVFFFAVTFLLTLVPATFVRFAAPHRVLDVARLWARIVVGGLRLICGIRLQVYGLEHLRGNEARLIASRHQSAFDTVVWLTLLPRCCYVLKRELLRIPLFGPLMPLTGMIGVDRTGGAAALRGLLREGERAAREGRQIVIFPEGTRAEPGAVLPLQPGVAALAGRTRLPVIPVVTDSGLRWGRRAFHKRPGTIHIRILEPIPAGTGRENLMRRLELALRADAIPAPQAGENSVGGAAGQLADHRNQQP
jgi:1-acyl-sn-glycerol-3-phosphate acyltransferase